MEERIWRELQPVLSAGEPPDLRTLSTVRSLVVNPSTSEATISSILETLSSLLSLPRHRHHHHTLSLLAALSISRPHLSYHIFPVVFSFFSSSAADDASSSDRLAAAALSLLLFIAESDSTLRSSIDSINDGLLIALTFRPCVQTRMWLLNNALRLRIGANLLVTVFLGFTKDPYPGVRKAALDGLSKASEAGISVGDVGIVEGCFSRAVELLGDAEDEVRAAAIRVVDRWGQMLAATKSESDYNDCSDFLFIQLCSMVRDMSVAVRLETFYAIGRIKVISDNILLLTLSKRIQGAMIVNKFFGLSSGKQYELPTSTVAGVFLHGLEDEFSEVRGASCKSIQTVSAISTRFSSEAVTLLMDVMNDDSVKVRMQALETVHHMALHNHLKLQQEHLQVLVATISDKSPEIRSGAMEILGTIKLPNIKSYKVYIGGLLGNLNLHPQDEAKTLSFLFKSGQVHSKFAFCVIENAYAEMTDPGGKLALDKPEMIGLVVLAISVSLSAESPIHHILQRLISAAGAFLGRISYALREKTDQETLLSYISRRGFSSLFSVSKDEAHSISHTSDIEMNSNCNHPTSSVDYSQMETDDRLSETLLEFREGAFPFTKYQKEMLIGFVESVKLILATTKSSWNLAKSSCTSEALKVLRCCQEEMGTLSADTARFSCLRDFGLHYVTVIELLIKLLDHLMFPLKHFRGMGSLDLLLNKLGKHIMHLRYRFTGFSKEDELHILEFVLLNHVLRLYRLQTCCKTSKKLSTTISQVVNLCQSLSVKPSEFVNEIERLSSENSVMSNGLIQRPLVLKNMLNLFDLKDIALSESIKHIKADLEFPGFDTEHPLPFIPGLPVGVPCEITLNNVSSEHRLWLDMKVDGESSQFLYLDLDQYGGSNEVMKFVYNAPLYRTLNAAAFALTVIIGMECSEDLQLPKGHVGPRSPLIYLCEEKEIELFRLDRI
ncbi:hypothetical protein V2J09_006759 [Rumex salicifolius]